MFWCSVKLSSLHCRGLLCRLPQETACHQPHADNDQGIRTNQDHVHSVNQRHNDQAVKRTFSRQVCSDTVVRLDAMKYLSFGPPVFLLVFLVLASEVSASSSTCTKAELTRQVIVFYPGVPARLPCKVFYTKPKENVLPRALWEAKNTQNYCKRKAAEFIEKLSLLGWHCFSDDLETVNQTIGKDRP